MSLKGIDISNHQRGLNLKNISCDFVIIKATEGKSYVDPSCDNFFQQALSLGKKLGVYHFANNPQNSAEQEANWFINNIPAKAPIIIIPSKAIFITPLRSENIPPMATIKRGIAKDIVCCTIK